MALSMVYISMFINTGADQSRPSYLGLTMQSCETERAHIMPTRTNKVPPQLKRAWVWPFNDCKLPSRACLSGWRLKWTKFYFVTTDREPQQCIHLVW